MEDPADKIDDLSVDDLIDILLQNEDGQGDDLGMTTIELCDATNLSRKTIRHRLRRLRRSGRLCVSSVLRESIDGRQVRRPSYYLVKENPAD